MLSVIREALDQPPSRFAILRGGPNGDREIVADGLDEPPEPERWYMEANVRAGLYRCIAFENGKFGPRQWEQRFGDLEAYNTIRELRTENRELEKKVEDRQEMLLELLDSLEEAVTALDAVGGNTTSPIDVPDVDLGGSDL